LFYRDVEELLAERGVEVDHVSVYRWVQRFTPLLVDAARPCRHRTGNRWFVDETYVKVAGRWRDVYRAIDQFGQSSTCSCPRAETPKRPTGSSNGRGSVDSIGRVDPVVRVGGGRRADSRSCAPNAMPPMTSWMRRAGVVTWSLSGRCTPSSPTTATSCFPWSCSPMWHARAAGTPRCLPR
jgi:hypothetical protein